MPEIRRFGSFKLLMFFQDENPPHVHIKGADFFAKVTIVEDGLGVAWPIKTKWGRLDVSASTLRRIAEEQEPMTGADFAQWRTALGLSLTEAASLLGVGRRTIMAYLKKDELPPV